MRSHFLNGFVAELAKTAGPVMSTLGMKSMGPAGQRPAKPPATMPSAAPTPKPPAPMPTVRDTDQIANSSRRQISNLMQQNRVDRGSAI